MAAVEADINDEIVDSTASETIAEVKAKIDNIKEELVGLRKIVSDRVFEKMTLEYKVKVMQHKKRGAGAK